MAGKKPKEGSKKEEAKESKRVERREKMKGPRKY
jgi:hypothetical protein